MFPTTMTLLANSLKIHFLEYCQTNISLTGSQIRQSWVCLFSLFLPSTNKSLFCFHWWLTIHQWTEFQYPMSNAFEIYITQELITYTALWWILCLWLFNFTYVQISCDKYIPLLRWIWPTFKQKSSLFYQQSLGMIQTRVPNSQFSLLTRSELQFS